MYKIIPLSFLLFLGFGLYAAPLFIPELKEGKDARLTIQKGELTLNGIKSDTFGYNGDYLGPTLRFDVGDNADIHILNSIGESTTLHWHGMHIPAEFDGGPHQIIQKDELWNPVFQIRQAASTLWYHPHLMGKTAEHVYKGLAGMIIIEDEFSKALNIPSDYGTNDIPLILQDRRIDKDGSFTYSPSMPDIMHGYNGNILLVNGQISPQLNIDGGIIRFRILNGSNSSVMRVRYDDNRSFRVIASDGGFLPKAVEMTELILSPGERFEILTDFSKTGKSELICDVYGITSYTALSIESKGNKQDSMENIDTDRPYFVRGENHIEKRREFRMETRGMRGFSINGKTMDIDRIDFKTTQGEAELWTVRNIGMGMMRVLHSFHVHDVQFRIIDINGEAPPPHLAGPKDTVLLMPGDAVRFVLNFQDYEGVYMYHCHFLEHEDNGMMGQFEVIE